MKKQLLCGVLSATLAVSCLSMGVYAEETAEPEASAPSQYAQETVQGSAVLHCFNWSYNTIRENLADIAAAGYTAVQTSPVQPPKNYNAAWTSVMDSSGGQWWKLYQPIDICVADGNTWLGTKAELAELCEEAETQYGIKVIVDIVANHLANIQSGGGFDNLSPEVPAALRHAEYFHDELKDTSYRDSSHSARYYSTHGQMGMPDLNTANSYIQGRMLGLLEECVDIGVDGFRFDAAKHIEVPNDPDDAKSDFWANVIGGINTYCEGNDLPAVFCYGEVLGDPGTTNQSSDYTAYMALTDSSRSSKARQAVSDGNAASLAGSGYYFGLSAADSVLWAESHDNYIHDETSGITDANLVKAWAITGARNESTSLFLARPDLTDARNAVMGQAGNDYTWKSKPVAEINKFKNYFNGESEYLSSSGKVAYIERGTSGVCISNLNGSGMVNLKANRIAEGTYQDQITGNTFTVSGGYIRGVVGKTGVAVVYNTDTPAPVVSEEEDYCLIGYINGSNYDGTDYTFENGRLTASFTADSYVYPKGVDSGTIYMTCKWLGTSTQSAVMYQSSVLAGNTGDKLFVPGNTQVTFYLRKNVDDSLTLCYETASSAFTKLTVGDADGSGELSIADATQLQFYLAGQTTLTDNGLYASDCDNSGTVNISDVTQIQKYLAEYEDTGMTAQEIPVPQSNQIYFKNSQQWENLIHCHFWSSSYSSAWPGVRMTYLGPDSQGVDVYAISVSKSNGNVIFNSYIKDDANNKKTVDIACSDTYQRYSATDQLQNSGYLVENW